MNLRNLPVISHVLEAGAADRVFDVLLLLGPLVIAVIAVLGRSVITELLAGAYIATFVAYVLYRGVR
ncbi:MAG: hypothetical protein ABEH90_07700 [Halolamina sp.]